MRFVEVKAVRSLPGYKQLLSLTKYKNLNNQIFQQYCYSQVPVIILKVMSWRGFVSGISDSLVFFYISPELLHVLLLKDPGSLNVKN